MASRRVTRPLAGLVTIGLVALLGPGAAWSVDAAQVTGKGTGPQPKGQGLGSKAALAQQSCAENGHTSFGLVGAGPWCVNPWPAGKDNGGSTAAGVTKDSVKVVIYIENEQQVAASTGSQPPVDQTTGKVAPVSDAIRDTVKAFQYAVDKFHTYQTWGRTPTFEIFTATGSDEAAQRADATAIAAKKPFLVFDQTAFASGGAPALASALAAKKIVVASASTTPTIARKQDPYRWAASNDPTAAIPLTAAFVGRSLAGEKAQWAGDKNLQQKTRAFAVIYPTSADFDFTSLQPQLTKYGAPKLATSVGYDPTNTDQAAQQATTYVTKIKDAGATSVILFAPNNVVAPIMSAATKQDYHPEWIFTGYGYQDFDGFARTYDQEQMRHAFGLSVLWPYADPKGVVADGFTWYWGKKQGVLSSIVPAIVGFVYGALHYAGPTLTAQNVRKGYFSAPSTSSLLGQFGYGNTVGMPYPEYALSGTDRALAWWDADTTGIAQAANITGKGLFQYLDNGKRFTLGAMPKSEPKFFDPNGAVFQVPYSMNFPDGVIPQAVPCPDCPSSGGSGSS